jgi:HupF/HypC family
VHPVIVGKRALPAVDLDGDDLVGTARLLARPGDIILGIGAADDGRLQSLLRRSDAWGLTSLWLGAGPRPSPGAADHVIWIDGSQMAHAARSGEIVMLYHLLWELTHVVFEHPGLLDEEPTCTDEVCVTCTDEGRVAEVAAVLDALSAEVVAAGVHETVDVSLVDRVDPGDLVLVHAGVAIGVLQEPGQ